MIEEVLVDTNVIIRLLVDDGSEQSRKAREWWEKVEQGEWRARVLESVLPEISYVMEKAYRLKKELYVPWIEGLFAVGEVKIVGWKKEELWEFFEIWKKGKLDLVDLMLHFKSKKEGLRLLSFDKKLKRKR